MNENDIQKNFDTDVCWEEFVDKLNHNVLEQRNVFRSCTKVIQFFKEILQP